MLYIVIFEDCTFQRFSCSQSALRKQGMLPQQLVWPETVATDQERETLYSYGCRHSLLFRKGQRETELRREAGLLAKGVRHTGVTNLSSKAQHLAGETWRDSFIDHRTIHSS